MLNTDCDNDGTLPRVGISACLLGHAVRFDGGHKRNTFLTETISQNFEWVPVCPEVEMGLGTPRPAIRLVQFDEGLRLKETRTDRDHTDRFHSYAKQRIPELESASLHGFVLKKDSPSCGMARVKVTNGNVVSRSGQGIFASALQRHFPNLPIEEEGRLCDPRLRENWVERVYAYNDLLKLWESDWNVGDLVRFHSRYKLTLLAHSEHESRRLGRLVAHSKEHSRSEICSQYESLFMKALSRISTRKSIVNALQHIQGFFKRKLDKASRIELSELIEDYRAGLVPLTVPLTLIMYFVRRLNDCYLSQQTFLKPHPKNLALRHFI